jgi:hypothetical protein
LFSGVGRAAINPEAAKFSPYGAICKAASLDGICFGAANARMVFEKQSK